MQLTEQLASHIRSVHFGGNWTDSNLKDKLADVTWDLAITKVHTFHPIATLVFHMNYFVDATIQVLQGGPLDAKDKYSFDHPPLMEDDWEKMLDKTWTDAENFASLVEKLPESKLWDDFVDKKYGTYYRCIQGPVEHCHYHLGQIVMIKSLLSAG